MADRIIQTETLQEIADAIKAKTGDAGIPVEDFAEKIAGYETPTEAAVVTLSLADGDQIVTPSEGKVFNEVRITKPHALVPEYIAEGVEIAGVIGAYQGGAKLLPAPTIAYKDGSASTIVITDTSGVADMYLVYVDGVYKGNTTSTEVDLNTFLAGMDNGTYAITIVALDTNTGTVSELSSQLNHVYATYTLTIEFAGETSYNSTQGFTLNEPYYSGRVTTVRGAGYNGEDGSWESAKAYGAHAALVTDINSDSTDGYGYGFTLKGIPASSTVWLWLGYGYCSDTGDGCHICEDEDNCTTEFDISYGTDDNGMYDQFAKISDIGRNNPSNYTAAVKVGFQSND